jgi:hypothetical protein
MKLQPKPHHGCIRVHGIASYKPPKLENRMSIIVRAGLMLAVPLAVLVLASTGCDGGREGDRCNPDLSHNDCNDGLTCIVPSTCVENYCCPTPASASTNPYCNGMACPMAAASTSGPDASADATGPDGSESTGSE